MSGARSFLPFLACLLIFSATGCASMSAERVGDIVYPPLPAESPIAVFQDERSVGAPFTVIGELDVDEPGKQQNLRIEDLIPRLSDMARNLGANGVIVDSREVVVSGVVSRGYAGHARAIRIFNVAPGPVAESTPIRGRLLPSGG